MTMAPPIPRSTVGLWHGRLVDLRVALEGAVKMVPRDSDLGGVRSLLDLCVADLDRVNLALEIVGSEWDMEPGNRHATGCRSEGLLP
jgi:hypothetical protein